MLSNKLIDSRMVLRKTPRSNTRQQIHCPAISFRISFALWTVRDRLLGVSAIPHTCIVPTLAAHTYTHPQMNSGGAVCACAQFNRGDQVDQLAEAGSLGWMLGWSVALLRVSTPGSPTFLSHHRRRPAALFRSFHHPFDREVGPPPSVGRLYPTRTLPTVCLRSLFHSVSVSLCPSHSPLRSLSLSFLSTTLR